MVLSPMLRRYYSTETLPPHGPQSHASQVLIILLRLFLHMVLSTMLRRYYSTETLPQHGPQSHASQVLFY